MNMVLFGILGSVRYRLGFGRAFVYEIIADVLWFFIEAAGFWVILQKFGTIGGWSIREVFLLFATGGVVYGIGRCFFGRGNAAVGWLIETGYVDLALTKPYNFYAAFVMGNVNPSHMPRLLLGIALMIYCIVRFVPPLGPLSLAAFIIGILGGIAICAALNTACGALAWRAVRAEYSMSLIGDLAGVNSYPVHIFPRVLQAAVTFVIPYALTNYYPTRYLIRDDVPGSGWLMLATLALGLVMFIGAYKLWMNGLSHYQSTGS